MNKTAARKAYDKLIEKFAKLNSLEDTCKTETEYEALKISQKAERDYIHTQLDKIKKFL